MIAHDDVGPSLHNDSDGQRRSVELNTPPDNFVNRPPLDSDLTWMAERVQRLTITLEQLQRASRSVSGMSRHIRSLAGHTGIEASRLTNAPALQEISRRLSALSEHAATLGHDIGRLLETHEAAIDELQRIVAAYHHHNRTQELAQSGSRTSPALPDAPTDTGDHVAYHSQVSQTAITDIGT